MTDKSKPASFQDAQNDSNNLPNPKIYGATERNGESSTSHFLGRIRPLSQTSPPVITGKLNFELNICTFCFLRRVDEFYYSNGTLHHGHIQVVA